jgi:hypothetical protein
MGDILALKENGVVLEGVMKFLQTNPIPFTDRHTLHNVVADEITRRSWDPRWRNELALDVGEPRDQMPTYDGIYLGLGKYFHIDVRNKHRDKLATNCSAYLHKAIKRPNLDLGPKTIEFKWAGTRLPSIGIAAKSARAFDAFHLLHAEPTRIKFNVHADSTDFIPQFPDEVGEYELTYLVTSENFPSIQRCFLLNLRQSLAETTLLPISPS